MRSERWKQSNPQDQAIVLLSNIEGTIINCVDGIISLSALEGKVDPLIRELREFHRGFVLQEWEESGGYYLIIMQKRFSQMLGVSRKVVKYLVRGVRIEHGNIFGAFLHKGGKSNSYKTGTYCSGALPMEYVESIYYLGETLCFGLDLAVV